MADHCGIGSAFGDQRFADVVDDVEIIMRHFTDQDVRPVEAGKRDLFPGCEFQTSVCAEVH